MASGQSLSLSLSLPFSLSLWRLDARRVKMKTLRRAVSGNHVLMYHRINLAAIAERSNVCSVIVLVCSTFGCPCTYIRIYRASEYRQKFSVDRADISRALQHNYSTQLFEQQPLRSCLSGHSSIFGPLLSFIFSERRNIRPGIINGHSVTIVSQYRMLQSSLRVGRETMLRRF